MVRYTKPLFRALSLMILTHGLWGCASSGASKLSRKNSFTKPSELAKISAKPLSETVLEDDGLYVETWKLKGPLPEEIRLTGIEGPQNKFEGALLDAIAQSSNKQMRASTSMRCAAREVGEFAIAHGTKLPANNIQNFIRHRCGSVSRSISSYQFTWNLDPGQTLSMDKFSQEAFTDVTDALKKAYAKSGPVELGLWFGQVEGKALLQITAGYRTVALETIPMVPASGSKSIVIEGELLSRAERLQAMITQGSYKAEHCVMDANIPLPKFRAVCPITPGDEYADFAIYDIQKDSIFSSLIFDQTIWPAGIKRDTYASSPIRQRLDSIDTTGLTNEQSYLTYLNAIRKDAGVDPVTIDAAQTVSVQELTPHMFEARRESDEKESSKIAMGLMAGWEISDNIVDADFQMTSTSDGTVSALIERTLSKPSGRKTLLSPDGDVLAVGEVKEGNNLGAMLLMYEFLPEETYIRRVARAWRTVNRARKLSKKKPIKRSKKLLSRSEEIARKMTAGTLSYQKGVDALMTATVNAYNSNVRSLTYLTHDLNDFELSKDVMSAKSLEAVIMVAPMNIDNYPWTIYAVVIVMPENRFRK